MCETDFSGYPDCRRDTLDAMEQALQPGHGAGLRHRDAADAPDQGRDLGAGQELGGEALVELIVEDSHTCYRGDRGDAARLGLWLRRLPGLRAARQGLARWSRRGADRRP